VAKKLTHPKANKAADVGWIHLVILQIMLLSEQRNLTVKDAWGHSLSVGVFELGPDGVKDSGLEVGDVGQTFLVKGIEFLVGDMLLIYDLGLREILRHVPEPLGVGGFAPLSDGFGALAPLAGLVLVGELILALLKDGPIDDLALDVHVVAILALAHDEGLRVGVENVLGELGVVLVRIIRIDYEVAIRVRVRRR